MAVLMLRSPQTLGEIRARAESMKHKFTSLQEVEAVVKSLIELAPQPLVTQLERQPGEREVRYAHLLVGTPAPVVRVEEKSELESRLEALEAEVRDLRRAVEELRKVLEG
jgi:uncharacterized protein YceH (UPF0502 family)